MTTRVTGLLVVLREPMREDAVQMVTRAVEMLRPVLEVQLVEEDEPLEQATYNARAKRLALDAVRKALYPEDD